MFAVPDVRSFWGFFFVLIEISSKPSAGAALDQ